MYLRIDSNNHGITGDTDDVSDVSFMDVEKEDGEIVDTRKVLIPKPLKFSGKRNEHPYFLASFVINSNHVFTDFYFPAATEHGTACINVWDVLENNSNFQVKLAVTDDETTANNINSVKIINIYKAWDITGLSYIEIEL
ncbi:hypothetical protein PIROE2DRAFT_13523 [Piromyces sp. E2]|nr:hypothetical protein PIROE2DRAFT_13523 [Piromyces sp. E2]|eukprot:OUM60661.1 hypothetical protein PIROE2DRAFT_13523 [Piromyces sp. E2]